MNKGLLLMAAAALILGIFKVPSFFKDSEFHGYEDQLAPGLRDKLNRFRLMWGAPVLVSGDPESVGRERGDSLSQHNVEKWGETRAIDVFPQGLKTQADALRAIAIAEDVGFTGIGLYPDKNSGVMLHLDVRPQNYVSKWAFIGGAQFGIEAGLNALAVA